MSYQIEVSFLELCDQSTCILVIPFDFEAEDRVVTLDLNIHIEDYEKSYWGRPCYEGYDYQVCRF